MEGNFLPSKEDLQEGTGMAYVIQKIYLRERLPGSLRFVLNRRGTPVGMTTQEKANARAEGLRKPTLRRQERTEDKK